MVTEKEVMPPDTANALVAALMSANSYDEKRIPDGKFRDEDRSALSKFFHKASYGEIASTKIDLVVMAMLDLLPPDTQAGVENESEMGDDTTKAFEYILKKY